MSLQAPPYDDTGRIAGEIVVIEASSSSISFAMAV